MKTPNRWKMIGLALWGCLLFSGCDEDDNPSFDVSTFVVETTVPDGVSNYYTGVELQIGMSGSTEILASATVGESGQAVFQRDMSLYAGQSLWFCVPGMVKFFHTLTSAEALEVQVTLPDKDKGSTLLTEGTDVQAGGKYYKNDWIVALYMGVNKGGDVM